MYCANCGKEFKPYERRTWTVLPGTTEQAACCFDDRSCMRRKWQRKDGQAPSAKMRRVREIACRYVMKGVI